MRATMFATAAVFLGLLAGPALAQGPIATAGGSGPAAPQPTAPAPPLSIDGAAPEQGQPVALGPCGPEKVKPNGQLETAPHGEVDAGVGTGGYRHIGGSVCQPIGQTGAVAVGVSETQFDQRYRRR
ncbi:MAG TPA: hypothetical protein VGM25_10765 [Caulobacteraceae bacterium]|jgi:hypothetical protein